MRNNEMNGWLPISSPRISVTSDFLRLLHVEHEFQISGCPRLSQMLWERRQPSPRLEVSECYTISIPYTDILSRSHIEWSWIKHADFLFPLYEPSKVVWWRFFFEGIGAKHSGNLSHWTYLLMALSSTEDSTSFAERHHWLFMKMIALSKAWPDTPNENLKTMSTSRTISEHSGSRKSLLLQLLNLPLVVSIRDRQ